jgi:hypothetical protein
MICEKCGKDLETLTCAGCDETVMKLGPYCYLCGHPLAKGRQDAGKAGVAGSGDNGEIIDLSDRILCSDGTCIGVVNEEGVCKVCGKPYTPDA